MTPLWIYLFFTALPLYVANASAVVSGGKTPLDFNRTYSDGKPWFGNGKTWKGTFIGIGSGTLMGVSAHIFFPEFTIQLSENYVLYAFLLSAGAIVGDIAGSFIKRRMNMKRGQPAHVLDQLDFVVGGILFSFLISKPDWSGLILLIMVTPFMHMAFNRLAFSLGLKKVPW